MESTKVKLPREVAVAIENFKRDYCEGREYRIHEYVGEEKAQSDAYVIVSWMNKSEQNVVLYYKALVNGYEVEQTPEDKVREWYRDNEKLLENGINGQYKQHIEKEQETIVRTLDILNIKISGVNAE